MGYLNFRVLIVFLCAMSMTACATWRHYETVRAGMLTTGTPQQVFLDLWGVPERTRTVTSDTEEKRLEFSRFGGFYGRANTTYEVWEYPKREVTLIFYGKYLSGWRTDKTTEQLRIRD